MLILNLDGMLEINRGVYVCLEKKTQWQAFLLPTIHMQTHPLRCETHLAIWQAPALQGTFI